MQVEQKRLSNKNEQIGEDYVKLQQQVAQQEGIIDMLRMQVAQIAQVKLTLWLRNSPFEF